MQETIASKRRRVLIVEEEGITLIYLSRVVTLGVGYDVVGVASNGIGAIAEARRLQPDFILMDYQMAGMNGIEAAKHILAEQSIPIILLTVHSEPEFVEAAEKAGICGYLVKPLDSSTILPAIKRCFDTFDSSDQGEYLSRLDRVA
jgi:response regulator NasT